MMAGCCRLRENTEAIPIERLRLLTRLCVPCALRKVAQLTEWARGLTCRNRPVQAVLLALIANELVRVLFGFIDDVTVFEVLLLGVGNCLNSGDCNQFVLSDA